MKDLQSITTFGAIDADNDDILLQCFEDHQAFQSLLKRRKFLIIGKKGSGKTSIFKKILKQDEENRFSIGHNFTDYPWHLHDKQEKIGVAEDERFAHSWKYLILLTLSKLILNNSATSDPFDDSSLDKMALIERFVVDTYGSKNPDLTQIFTPTYELKLSPKLELNLPGFFKAGVAPEKIPILELPTIISEVNSNLMFTIFQCLNKNYNYYVCFDQLDLGFDPSDKNYEKRLIGLILASRDINVKARENKVNLSVCIFLRDDIYNDLQFNDKNKITENFSAHIEWDTERTPDTLKSLMEKRFTTLLSDHAGEKVTWNDVFDEDQEMSGHQTKYQHILDRTFLRPRDIIKFCNEILLYHRRRETLDADVKFSNIDINKAESAYSNYFLRELDDEIHQHIRDYKECLEIIKHINSSLFTKEEFQSAYEDKKLSLPERHDAMEILKDLFLFSIIGYYRAGGRGYGGSEYIYRYKNPGEKFDDSAEKFRVHPGFVESLGLKRYTRTR